MFKVKTQRKMPVHVEKIRAVCFMIGAVVGVGICLIYEAVLVSKNIKYAGTI